jgi:hypothetical protein
LAVVPKIYYKQNINDPAKGADSVHIVLEGENDFSIWFGEAKFYNNIENVRFNKVIESVHESLKTTKLKKENSIITSLSDIDYLIGNIDLRNKIKKCLSTQESIDSLKPKLNIPILLLHECGITEKNKFMTQDYTNEIIEFHKDRAQSYFKKQIESLGDLITLYSEIKFHIILFPVPNKKNIVDSFINQANFFKQK